MNNLISGKEAKLAWANGQQIELKPKIAKKWLTEIKDIPISVFDSDFYEFRLKPRTIAINGIEVPTPFKPKAGDMVWCLNELTEKGYEARTAYDEEDFVSNIGYWRSESDIMQVVRALRSVFKTK